VKVAAVIPSIGLSPHLGALVEALAVEGIHPWVISNRQRLDGVSARATVLHLPGAGLYHVWNFGLDLAVDAGAAWCAVLNDDVILSPGAIRRAVDAADVDPGVWIAGLDYEGVDGGPDGVRLRPAVGSYHTHGVGGFAFCIRPDVDVRCDESFEWWGGDDDLIWTVLDKGGRAVVVEGARVSHPCPETSAVHFPELEAAKGRDRERLAAKWGRAW